MEPLKDRRISIVQPRPPLLYLNEFRQRKTSTLLPMPNRSCRLITLELMNVYGQETTIHGVKQVFELKSSKWERILWLIFFLLAFSFLVYFSLILAARYQRRLFKTVIDNNDFPIYMIDFPEVIICNNNRLNWQRYELAKQRHLLPRHREGVYEKLFMEVLSLYDTFSYGEFERFAQLSNRSLGSLNYVNFTNVVKLMAWRCDEIFTDCTWNRKKFDCCELFVKRHSQLGQCLAFNSIEGTEGLTKMFFDSKWPWHLGQRGQGTGLTVRVLLKEEWHSPMAAPFEKGVTFTILEPGVWSSYPMIAHKWTKTRVKLNAIISVYDAMTKRVSSKVRECVFADELDSIDFKTLQDHEYMFENCQSECQQEYLMQFCNCSIDLFYPVGRYPSCKLVDMPCVAQHQNLLTYFEQTDEREYVSSRLQGMVCTCFLNCRSLSYTTDVRAAVLQKFERVLNESYVDMDFYYSQSPIMVYKTTLIYTWLDLLASFGGATCLFLGCSLISFVELVYFFFVQMPERIHEEYKQAKNKGKKKSLK